MEFCIYLLINKFYLQNMENFSISKEKHLQILMQLGKKLKMKQIEQLELIKEFLLILLT